MTEQQLPTFNLTEWQGRRNKAQHDYGRWSCSETELLQAYEAQERDFRRANLRGANLRGADLGGANLRGADLGGANLINTCLDPQASIPAEIAYIIRQTFRVDADGYFTAYRTKFSRYITPSTEYKIGETYSAPIFSISTETECHPGLYFATLDWLEANNDYSGRELVTVRVHISDALVAGDKFRCRKFTVIAGEPEKGEEP